MTALPTWLSDEHTVVPKYQCLDGVNVEKYVTVKLISRTYESSNYSSWKLQMESLIKSHQLMGFINGRIRIPIEEDKDCNTWMTDKVVNWWFHCTISDPTLIAQVRQSETSREAWLALQNSFEETGIEDTLKNRYFNFQIPLLKATLQGNWDKAQRILNNYSSAGHNYIDDGIKLTPLAYAVCTGTANHTFVEKLLALMPDDSVAVQDCLGRTALHDAAAVGNVAAARSLVSRNHELCYIPSNVGLYPVQYAAMFAQKEMLRYLITKTGDDNHYPNPCTGSTGLKLLIDTIEAEFFGG